MAVSILHAAAYREWPYNYGGAEDQLGYEAFVVKHTGDTVRLVRHRLKFIEVVEMPLAEFMMRYSPDLTMAPHLMAREFINFLTFMQAPPDVRELISTHTKINYPDREFQMTRPKKAAAKPAAKSTKTASKKTDVVGVYADSHRRTCIVIAGDENHVKFIPLGPDGFDIEELDRESFNQQYRNHLSDYPVERAARLYVGYSINLGGTKEALKALGQFTTVTDKEITMATTKRANRGATKTAAKTPAAKPAAKKAATKAPAKSAPATKKPTARQQAAAAKKEKGVSAAGRFQELIMAGKMTDDKIFETVQKEFGLDDNKRSYVRWYRNKLVKDGMNPPAAK